VRYWIDQSEALAKGGANAFLPKLNRVEGKLPVTTFGLWDLAPDEGLMIEFTDPQADFWAFQLSTSLWRTIDFANRLSTSNPAHAHRDEDGVYRFVLSGRDPEIYNWLDTTGLARGIVIVRFCSAKHPNAPRARKIKLSALTSELPNAKPCTPAERRVQIAQRREGVAHMICD
jgi:hypothetical protein